MHNLQLHKLHYQVYTNNIMLLKVSEPFWSLILLLLNLCNEFPLVKGTPVQAWNIFIANNKPKLSCKSKQAVPAVPIFFWVAHWPSRSKQLPDNVYPQKGFVANIPSSWCKVKRVFKFAPNDRKYEPRWLHFSAGTSCLIKTSHLH